MQPTRVSRLARLGGAGLVLGFALLAAGCSGTGTVTGKVTFGNQVVGGGKVLFTSAEGKGSVSADIEPDGTYKAEKVPTGEVKVAVDTSSAKPTQGPAVGGPQNKKPGGVAPNMPLPPADQVPAGADPSKLYGGQQPKGKYVAIPEKYTNPSTSELTLKVKSGTNEYDIPLK
jgi:hypothetical protein